MIEIGQSYTLSTVKILDFGAYLDAENLGEILLPLKYMPHNLSEGDEVDVFIYLDSEDRPIATTLKPKAQIGEFAYLTATDTTSIGAFLDWGLEKDILLPFSEQHRKIEVGHSYLVYLYIDKIDARVVASGKIDKFVEDFCENEEFEERQSVDLIIGNSTELGFKAIVNQSHWGVLYKNEVFQKLSFGQSIKGYIKRIREDGKIDLSLQAPNQETRDKFAQIILNYLEANNGYAPVHDKSDPAQISKLFGMSKGAFKKTIGGLYKQRLIVIEKDGIYLVNK